MVLHSPWWIVDHWGRLFDVERLEPHGLAAEPGSGQGAVALRKVDRSISRDELERPGSDPRELTALAHGAGRLLLEATRLRRACTELTEAVAESNERVDQLSGERARLEADVASWRTLHALVTGSRSWRLTAPLRAANALRTRLRG
jgi:hypothetical protein